MEEIRIDVRTQSPERIAEAKRSSDLCFRINHTNPTTSECKELIDELFNHTLGENTILHPPIFTILADKVKIGKNVTILNNFQCMSAGGLTIEDNTMISLNCITIFMTDMLSPANLSISNAMYGLESM